MRNFLLFILFFVCFFSAFAQNIRFSYQVVRPYQGDMTKSGLVVYAQKINGGTENVSGFNYGFYYKSSEATVEGFAAGAGATSVTLTASQLAIAVDQSIASGIGWNFDGTGAIVPITSPPNGLPSGYNRLFIGSIVDGNGVGEDLGSTPVAIVALILDNAVGGAPVSTDSAYMGGTDTNGAWAYSNIDFNEFPVVITGARLQQLPITLISFDAKKYDERNAHLTWSTANETNSSHFNVQRSLDQKTWTTVGKVNSHGNSQIVRNYEFLDQNVYNGIDSRLTAYYRLQAVDFDDQAQFSSVRTVVFLGTGANQESEIVVYPNPSSEGVQVEWDATREVQPTRIEFFGVNGQLVYAKDIADKTNQEYVDYSTTNILPGLYILRILNGNEMIDHKQIVVSQR